MSASSESVQYRFSIINQQQDMISSGDFGSGPAHPLLLHDILAVFTESRCINDMQWQSINLNELLERVAGCAGDGGDDGAITAGQPVEQAGFTGIGSSGDDQRHAVPQQLSLTGGGTDDVKPLEQICQPSIDMAGGQKLDILVDEVYRRLNVEAQLDERLNQFIDLA